MRTCKRWTRDEDLELIRGIFKGFTGEGLAEHLNMSLNRIRSRTDALGFTLHEARSAKRNGATPESYLASSPVYARQPELPLGHESPEFYLFLAEFLERAAFDARLKAAKS